MDLLNGTTTQALFPREFLGRWLFAAPCIHVRGTKANHLRGSDETSWWRAGGFKNGHQWISLVNGGLP